MLSVSLVPDQPKVAQIERQIREQIESGRLRSGAWLPSIRQTAQQLGISKFTVVAAYDRLVAACYIQARQKRGYQVLGKQLDHLPERTATSTGKIDSVWLMRALQESDTPLKLGSGILPADWFDQETLMRSARAALRRSGTSFPRYPTALGYRPLRDLLALKMIEMRIAAQADQIMLTSGASHALDLVLREFVGPQDTILIESPGYYCLFSYLRMHGIASVAIPRTDDGLDLAAFEEALIRFKPRLLVLNTVLHNPTASTLSSGNAYRIMALADKYDLIIVEDDICGDFYTGPAVRLANIDQLNRVIYISSFSKTVSANLRVGFVAASRDVIRRLTDRKLVTYLATSEISERIVTEILLSGEYRRQIDRINEKLALKRGRVAARLESIGLTISGEPDAGYFLWARFSDVERSDILAEIALRHGLILAAGNIFSPDGAPSAWMRFNIAYGDTPALDAKMQDCISEYQSTSGRS